MRLIDAEVAAVRVKPASARVRPGLRLTSPNGRGPRRELFGSAALALLATLVMLAAISGLGRSGPWRWDDSPPARPHASEEVVLLQAPATSAPAPVTIAQHNSIERMEARARRRLAGSPSASVAPHDSVVGSAPTADSAAPPVAPSRVPSVVLGGRAALGISTDGRSADASRRDSAIAAFGAAFPSLSKRRIAVSAAERDSVLRMEQLSHPPGTRAELTMGGSIAVGLPGGGPTRAQRKRDSTLDAGYQQQLARIRSRMRQRVDSDSIARAQPRSAPDAAD